MIISRKLLVNPDENRTNRACYKKVLFGTHINVTHVNGRITNKLNEAITVTKKETKKI